jgi:pentatricopeptide repeat protein
MQFRRGKNPLVLPPLPTQPTSSLGLSGEASDPIVPLCQEAELSSLPQLCTDNFDCESDFPEIDDVLGGATEFSTPLNADSLNLWDDQCDADYGSESIGGLDDLWLPAADFLTSPEASVTADANSVLETALASGDAKLADAALGAGIRLCSSTWLGRACSQLQDAGIPIMPERALDLIRVYGHDRRADLAVDLWEAHCLELGLDPADGDESEPPPAAELYGSALEACARAGDFESAARAAKSAGWRVPPGRHSQTAFLSLARWYARRQDVGQALVCYKAVRKVTGSTDLATHRAVLIATVRSADMNKADALFQDLISSGLTPDGASFSAMICGHCSASNIDKAMNYFHLLRERGIVPTAPLFDAILDGCAWMNMPALMEQVLADMEATGIRPSTTTLSILMRLHGLNRETEQALALFEELPKKHGLKLDGHAYGTLISVCLKNDVYDMAWNAFQRMSADGHMAHARIYDALIAACLRRGHLDNAVQVVYEALGMAKQQADEPMVMALRLRLQSKTIEDTLQLIGRRRQASRLGAPMVEQLLAAGVELPAALVEAVMRCAKAETREISCSELHRRRAQRCEWRNFPAAIGVC